MATRSRSPKERARETVNSAIHNGGTTEPARPRAVDQCGPRAGHLHHLFGIARKIKSPSQTGCATPWRYARSDSTEELTRRLLYDPSAFCQRSCQYSAALIRG